MWEYRGLIEKVVDGDTLDVQLDLGLDVSHRTRIRLAGLNAPERGTVPGKLASEFVATWITKHQGPNGWFIIRTAKDRREKYGRYLASIIGADGSDLGLELIAAGLALPWDGQGPMPTFTNPSQQECTP